MQSLEKCSKDHYVLKKGIDEEGTRAKQDHDEKS